MITAAQKNSARLTEKKLGKAGKRASTRFHPSKEKS
jgi:hypothetical protein